MKSTLQVIDDYLKSLGIEEPTLEDVIDLGIMLKEAFNIEISFLVVDRDEESE